MRPSSLFEVERGTGGDLGGPLGDLGAAGTEGAVATGAGVLALVPEGERKHDTDARGGAPPRMMRSGLGLGARLSLFGSGDGERPSGLSAVNETLADAVETVQRTVWPRRSLAEAVRLGAGGSRHTSGRARDLTGGASLSWDRRRWTRHRLRYYLGTAVSAKK